MKIVNLTDAQHNELITLAKNRYQASFDAINERRADWQRFWKIYRAASDESQNSDENNTFIPYAFGVVEDILARITEPILQKFSIRVSPKKAGEDKEEAEKKAKSFYNYARTYVNSAEYQLNYIDSEREKIITGSSWEMDEWVCEGSVGKKWAKKEFGEVVKSVGMAEVEHQYIDKQGYNTRFPSIFNVFPEPGVKDVKRMNWIIEELPTVMLDDLQKEQYKDPETGLMKPVYDFSRCQDLFKAKNVYPIGITESGDPDTGKERTESKEGSQSQNDTKRVNIVNIYERNRIFTVLNGRWVIRCVEEPFHVPGLKWRIKVYTQDKENLYGIGAIEPVEYLLYELNDTHNIHMQNQLRIVNRMIAYSESGVPFPDDFNPRAGGRIRVRAENVHSAIMDIPQADVGSSMALLESNGKGLLERVLSIADLSPGVDGTKAYHKTYGGLMEIQQSLARRFSIMRRIALANQQQMMKAMYDLCSQFMFDEIEVIDFAQDISGKQLTVISREAIDTNGEGFNFIIENDPSFGDEQVQRNQNMVLFDLCMKYEQFRMASRNPNMKPMDLTETLKDVFESFGRFDNNRYFIDTNIKTPEEEFSMFMNGQAPMPQPFENFGEHLATHITQVSNPQFQADAQSGKVSPDVLAKLVQHIGMTRQMMVTLAKAPEMTVQLKLEEKNNENEK